MACLRPSTLRRISIGSSQLHQYKREWKQQSEKTNRDFLEIILSQIRKLAVARLIPTPRRQVQSFSLDLTPWSAQIAAALHLGCLLLHRLPFMLSSAEGFRKLRLRFSERLPIRARCADLPVHVAATSQKESLTDSQVYFLQRTQQNTF